MDKATLLDKIRTRQAEFEELLAPLHADQLTAPGVNGAWSVKDILAHIMAWQKRTLDRLHAAAYGVDPDLQAVRSDAEMDDLNTRIYAENKSRPLTEVMADFKNTYAQVWEGVQAVSEEDLIEPKRFAWLEGGPLWELVAANTYEHINEHIGSIQAWLEASGRAPGRA